MNLLDENVPIDQRDILSARGVRCRVIGVDISRFSVGDDNIISLLHRLKQPTFFTRDEHFFRRALCHACYCLVWLNVKPVEAAEYVSLFLRHSRFNTKGKRMGVVARAHHDGILFFIRSREGVQSAPWSG